MFKSVKELTVNSLRGSCFCSNWWQKQGTTNYIQYIQMYNYKSVVYASFLEAAQILACQCNILLISFAYFELAFFIG